MPGSAGSGLLPTAAFCGLALMRTVEISVDYASPVLNCHGGTSCQFTSCVLHMHSGPILSYLPSVSYSCLRRIAILQHGTKVGDRIMPFVRHPIRAIALRWDLVIFLIFRPLQVVD